MRIPGQEKKTLKKTNQLCSSLARETVWALATISREINVVTSKRTDVAIVATTTAGCVAS